MEKHGDPSKIMEIPEILKKSKIKLRNSGKSEEIRDIRRNLGNPGNMETLGIPENTGNLKESSEI